VSNPEKLGDVGEQLLKWLADPTHAAKRDRFSAEYDRRAAERRERETSSATADLERLRGLPLTQHPGVEPRPWPTYCLIHGAVGVGKTRRAVEHLLSVPRDSGIFVGFAEFLDLARWIDNKDGAAGDFERRRYAAAFRRTFLVLDDFGARRPTPAAIDYVLALIKEREDQGRFRTIVTSNYTIDEIERDWDEPIGSRLGGLGPALPLEGHDWRRRRSSRRPEGRTLRLAPDSGNSQGALLEDLEPGRPRNGGGA
jgi:hypothetical protein